MKKSTKFIAAATAVLLTLGAAGCTKNTYPDFINPTELEGPVESSEKYVINVQSEGGMKLDGVKVSAVRGGQVIKRGISRNGKIELGVALGDYKLVVDEASLPAGYHLPDATYKTNASSREEVTIKIPSALIPANSSVEATYALGTVMKDFTFTDCRGTKYQLSDLLKVKKAVALNFWYSGCGPCRAEFPHVQRAYAGRTDIEFLAICSTHQGDTNAVVENYRTENGLTFPMGVDTIGMNSAFGVDAFPTTVVIDRYGLIAYRSKGTEPTTSFWTKLFNDFCSDDYTQKLSIDGSGEP
ncbi:MAG: TlpA family protein disulfide reductase, partial [Clostridia bacterium]|nr:TlpA family protein disulfide reductase [Clostridia bacterium]